MTLKLRPYAGESDWQIIAELIQSDPNFHYPIDFPWRLSSTSLEDYRNAALWEDANGQIQAFATLQFAWLTLDFAIRPAVHSWEVETQILDWAETRLRQIAQETNDHFPFNVSAFAQEQERITFLEARGYTRWDNFLVMLSHSLESIPPSDIPAGFVIRPLAGESEVAQYVSLHQTAFESTNMTIPWRLRTLRVPLYDPELDLVAVASDGRLAGFCIWWYNPKLKTAQIEPLGVHADFQHLGLSQALMFEGLRRVAAKGAEIAQVEAYNFNQPALNAYQAIGFRPTSQKFKYFKEY